MIIKSSPLLENKNLSSSYNPKTSQEQIFRFKVQTFFLPSMEKPIFLFSALFFSFLLISHQQEDFPPLDAAEQESVFAVLSSINSDIPWRTLFPEDLCLSAPHGVVCEAFIQEGDGQSGNHTLSTETAHITELSFGYVSDYSPNPPCSPNSTLNPLLFTSFKYLRKLFFYKCFTETPVSLGNSVPGTSFGASIEELVFVENPALVGPLSGIVGNFTALRRLVLTGNGIYGNIPEVVSNLVNIEEITLSRNQLSGGFSFSPSKLKKLRLLDLSQNHFDGIVPDSLSNLTQLLKLDLSSNGFSGKIPESLGRLQSLEFLDMSFNSFGSFGLPVFLGEMQRLKEVHLSGNLLGGQIPEIWEKLGGISGIGFSNMGLVGNIPASMGLHLRNLCYLGLDNNELEGEVPKEFGFLEFVNEINLENNNLTGKLPFPANFTAKVGEKLKLKGNSGLCVDQDQVFGKDGDSSFRQLKMCSNSRKRSEADVPNGAALFKDGSTVSSSEKQVLSSCSNGIMTLGFLIITASSIFTA